MELLLSFKTNIKVRNGFSPEFFFHKIFTASGDRYHISLIKDGEMYNFIMAEKVAGWKIISAPEPPQWVLDIEHELGEILAQSE